MYKNGTVATPRDPAKAQALFREAVDNGCADGHNGLGDIYQSGYCGKVDLIKAAEEFTIAAEEGADPYWIGYAYLSLGAVNRTKYAHFEEDYCDYEAYARGKPDYETAVAYYEKAAELWSRTMIRHGALKTPGHSLYSRKRNVRYPPGTEQHNGNTGRRENTCRYFLHQMPHISSIKSPSAADTACGGGTMRTKLVRESCNACFRIEPEKQLCPIYDEVGIRTFRTGDRHRMGFCVVDDFVQEHIQ